MVDLDTLAKRVKFARVGKSLTQAQVAELAGLKQADISKIEKGMIQRTTALIGLARALEVNPHWLDTGDGSMSPDNLFDLNISPGPDLGEREYPVLTAVQAGNWGELCENFSRADATEWRRYHKDLGPCGFVLRVEGESMTAPGGQYSFPPGMLLFCRPHSDWTPGQFVIAARDHEKAATFKKIVLVDGEPYLEALNPQWPKRFLQMHDGDRVCAVVVDASFGTLP